MANRISLEQLVEDSLADRYRAEPETDGKNVDPLNGYAGPIYPRENQMDPTSLAELDALNTKRGVPTTFAENFPVNREMALTEAQLFALLDTIS